MGMQTSRLMKVMLLGLVATAGMSGATGKTAAEAQEKAAPAVYTQAQADRGAKLYNQYCVNCHKTEEMVNDRMKSWAGSSAQELFSAIRLTMPEDNPGSLSRQQYADILAHMLRLCDFKPGTEELKGADDVLKTITISCR